MTDKWKKIYTKFNPKGNFPPEKIPIRFFVNYGNGFYNVFSGHVESKCFLMFDPFTDQFRVFRRQQYITHWKKMDDMPSGVKRNIYEANAEKNDVPALGSPDDLRNTENGDS